MAKCKFAAIEKAIPEMAWVGWRWVEFAPGDGSLWDTVGQALLH